MDTRLLDVSSEALVPAACLPYALFKPDAHGVGTLANSTAARPCFDARCARTRCLNSRPKPQTLGSVPYPPTPARNAYLRGNVPVPVPVPVAATDPKRGLVHLGVGCLQDADIQAFVPQLAPVRPITQACDTVRPARCDVCQSSPQPDRQRSTLGAIEAHAV